MAGVNLDRICKFYGTFQAIHDVSFDLADGEFLSLVGPSGCGKSTLLRMIAGLEDISSGDIRIGDQVVNETTPKNRDIAMVFQNYALYPHMTVRKNMGFSLRLRGEKRRDIDKLVDEAAQILELESQLEKFPRQLSGGQRQRVAMGRALVRRPQVFLFDEPLSNLDASLRVSMRAEIKALQRRFGVTSIFVTHDQTEAMTIADRIAVLRAGRVEQIGPPDELYDRPASTFVAQFIGSPAMNLMSGTINVEQGVIGVKTKGGVFVENPTLPDNLIGMDVVMGIRPEHLVPSDSGILTGSVRVVEMGGALTTLILDGPDGEIVAQTQDRMSLAEGDVQPLTVLPNTMHLFDAATQTRINL